MKLTRIVLYIFLILLTVYQPASAQSDNDAVYTETIANADKYFKEGDYIKAKASYQYASQLKPDESYPKQKLAETVNLLREKMAVMEQYSALVSDGDQLFRSGDFEQAIKKYEQALKIVPNESYPREKIDAINKQVSEAKEKQDNYDNAIRKAETLEKYNKFEEAKAEYELAQSIFPN
jgi:tetratricopeptide (TPR) repeat protein